MTSQKTLFIQPVKPIEAKDPNVPEAAKGRLSRQCREVLDMLRIRPRTNAELAAITHRFGARIWDLRKAGYGIIALERDHATGLVLYKLAHDAG